MTRFEQEWALVPAGARVTAAAVALVMTVLMGGIFLLPPIVDRDPKALFILTPYFLLTLIGAVVMAAYVLLVGYVYGDARRRGMNHVLWAFLAVLIPYMVGVILYFILREPLLVSCPRCGTPARKGHAYCASCGTAVRAACPQCRQPVEPAWRNCARCGATLPPAASGSGLSL